MTKNIEQSIRQRLLNISRNRREDFQFLLVRYALERFLYRLSKSEYTDRFILKGAFLLMAWSDQPYRPTRDLDLLSFGESSSDGLVKSFVDICQTEVELDGLVFDTNSITVNEIREDQVYEGQRVKLMAFLGKARIPLQIDIGYGDLVTPQPETFNFPSIIGMAPARIRAYPKETVVAEKLQAAANLGMQNSRMKDFYDLLWLARFFSFEGTLLVKAIRTTFQHRKSELHEKVPLALTDEFSKDQVKQIQWQAFMRKNGISEVSENLEDVVIEMRKFLIPPLEAAVKDKKFALSWISGGPWR